MWQWRKRQRFWHMLLCVALTCLVSNSCDLLSVNGRATPTSVHPSFPSHHHHGPLPVYAGADSFGSDHPSAPLPRWLRFRGAIYSRVADGEKPWGEGFDDATTASASMNLHDRYSDDAHFTSGCAPPAEPLLRPYTRVWWLTLTGTVACVCLAALAAGLTVGLVSIDPLDLAVIQMTQEEDCSSEEEVAELREEKTYADRLMPLVQRHHLLLVTLLIMNSCANEMLPLLLDRIVPSWLAVVLSVTAVLLFGEILPSSIFTGKNQLKLAAALSPLVYFFQVVLFILAYPIASLLDWMLGVEDESVMRRSELKSLIRLQAGQHPPQHSPTNKDGGVNGVGESGVGGLLSTLFHVGHSPSPDSHNGYVAVPSPDHLDQRLTSDEMTIIHGVLELKGKTIRDAMVPLDDVYMLPLDTVLDIDSLAEILSRGHSRIPLYDGDRTNVRGVLLVKRLIVVSPADNRILRTIGSRWPLICAPDTPLLEMLNLFQTGRSHMAIVCDQPDVMMAALRAEEPLPPTCTMYGMITLEDVLELLIKEDIADETDFGVRILMERSAIVRRRVEKLKQLARAAAGTATATRGLSHVRTQSVARLAALTAATSDSSGTATPYPPTRRVSLVSPSSGISMGYQADDRALSEMHRTPSISHRITTLSQTSPFSDISATTKTPLPRDEEFTKQPPIGSRSALSRTSSLVAIPMLTSQPYQYPTSNKPRSQSIAANNQPPPTVPTAMTHAMNGSSSVAMTPRSSSILAPRAHFSSLGLQRRADNDAELALAVKQLAQQPPRHDRKLSFLNDYAATMGTGTSSSSSSGSSINATPAAAYRHAYQAEDEEKESLLEKGRSVDNNTDNNPSNDSVQRR